MNQLGVFAKYWQPGSVKTRLAATIGPASASQLYRCFVTTILDRFSTTGDDRFLCYAPPERRQEFLELSPPTWQCRPQGQGDLGTRMFRFLEERADGNDAAVLIGSDSPNLPTRLLDDAFRLLDAHSVVLGPSTDGGYYLVGARGSPPGTMFQGIDWSSDRVWFQTVQQLEKACVEFAELPEWYDVDEYVDLQRLAKDLSQQQLDDPSLAALHATVRGNLRWHG